MDGTTTTWTVNNSKGAIFRSQCEIDKFVVVEVDGQTVAINHYSVTPGSTVVELKPSYLKTLSTGSHYVKLVFTDGYSGQIFSIHRSTSVLKIILVILLIISLGATAAVGYILWNKNRYTGKFGK